MNAVESPPKYSFVFPDRSFASLFMDEIVANPPLGRLCLTAARACCLGFALAPILDGVALERSCVPPEANLLSRASLAARISFWDALSAGPLLRIPLVVCNRREEEDEEEEEEEDDDDCTRPDPWLLAVKK